MAQAKHLLHDARMTILAASDEIDRLKDTNAELLGVLRDIRDELEQANGGKGPQSVLSQHILNYTRSAIAKARGDS